MKKLFVQALLGIGALALCTAASAQAWPSRPILLIVPWAAGGATDIAARTLAARLQESLGQPVLVENKTGVNGSIATEFVAQAAPDGYTVQIGGISLAINQYVYTNLRFDLARDLQPVAMLAGNDNVLLVPAGSAARSVADLVRQIKARGAASNYASAGIGASTHLTAELFKMVNGLEATHIPFKGSSPALVELGSGRVEFMFDNIAPTLPLIKSGRIRPLAVTGATRNALLPDIPTLKELGMDVEVTSWTNVMVPAKTPRAIVDRLNAEVNKALVAPDLQARFAQASLTPIIATPERAAEVMRNELIKWQPVVRLVNIKAE